MATRPGSNTRVTPELPINKFRDQIVETVRRNPMTVLIGATGSGGPCLALPSSTRELLPLVASSLAPRVGPQASTCITEFEERGCHNTLIAGGRECTPMFLGFPSHPLDSHCIPLLPCAGKSTQLAKMLLAAGVAGDGAICVTQPRRVAAVSVARYEG